MDPGQRRLKILVVEDNPGDLLLIQEAFRECELRCDLAIADTIAEAIRLAKENRFDLVISDMSVSNDESATFFEWMRSQDQLKSTPIVVVSGNLNPSRAYAAGANAFVAKSTDVDQFFEKIRAMMDFWVNVAELPRE
jgi:CheY-like chemotaxis protein